MAEETKSLEDLKEVTGIEFAGADNALPEAKIDAQRRAYATGKPKDAVARVWVKPGTGRVSVNGRDIEVFFARPTQRMIINQYDESLNHILEYFHRKSEVLEVLISRNSELEFWSRMPANSRCGTSVFESN